MKLLYVLIVALVALSNIKHQAEANADLTVECFPDVNITMKHAYVRAFTQGLAENDMVIGNNMKDCPKIKVNGTDLIADLDSKCTPTNTSDGWMWSLTNPTSCNAKKMFDAANKTMTFEYVIHRAIPVEAGAVVRRKACGCIVVQCEFDSEFDASTEEDEVQIIEEKIVMDGKTQEGDFNVTMTVVNATSGDPITQVKLGESLRLKTELNKGNSAENYTLSVNECFVTQTFNKSVAPKYNVVNNMGCAASNTGDDSKDIVKITNGVKNEAANFKLESFVWLNTERANQKMFFHCKVQVCVSSHKECVENMKKCNSGSRKRRSADQAAAPEEHSISFGPITIDRSVDEAKYHHGVEKAALPCSLNNGNCAEVCVNTYGSGHVCACRPGRILNEDGRTCTDYVRNSEARTTFVKVEPAQTSSGSSSDSMFVVAAVAIIAVLNIIGVLLVVSRKGKQFPV